MHADQVLAVIGLAVAVVHIIYIFVTSYKGDT